MSCVRRYTGVGQEVACDTNGKIGSTFSSDTGAVSGFYAKMEWGWKPKNPNRANQNIRDRHALQKGQSLGSTFYVSIVNGLPTGIPGMGAWIGNDGKDFSSTSSLLSSVMGSGATQCYLWELWSGSAYVKQGFVSLDLSIWSASSYPTGGYYAYRVGDVLKFSTVSLSSYSSTKVYGPGKLSTCS